MFTLRRIPIGRKHESSHFKFKKMCFSFYTKQNRGMIMNSPNQSYLPNSVFVIIDNLPI